MISLKTQVTLFLAFFVILLVSQLFFARSNQAVLVESFSSYQLAVNEEKIVKDLERDVLDLQRYVLIFNNTSNQSATDRFDNLYTEIEEALSTLFENLPKELQNENTEAMIRAMSGHIYDYNENFASATSARYARDKLFTDSVLSELNTRIEQASNDFGGSAVVNDTNIALYQYHLSRAENLAFQYLLTPNSTLKDDFVFEINQANAILQNAGVDPAQTMIVSDELANINGKFSQLSLSTQNYLFLVNVVMAGAANEFLYLAKELSILTAQYSQQTNKRISETILDAQQKMHVSSFIGVALTLVIGLFAAYRIIHPIKEITDAFEQIIADKQVDLIPGIHRTDEIGQLAKAARVFKANIVQTQYLLKNAQELNESQSILNMKLEEAKVLAEKANASKSVFLANMSHEIRTPMNGIIGLIDLSLHQELNSNVRANLEKVAYSSQILMNVINDILDFSKIEAGKLVIENSYFSFASLFDNLLAVVSLRAAEKNLNLQLYVDPDLPTNAIGDPLRLSQVILNLCSNAIKFTRTGSVNISFTFKTAPLDTRFILVVKIEDTGIGMTAEQLARIFQPFMQADGSTSREFGGTGLGLSIVTQLTELMGGNITANSVLGEGSAFECEFLIEHEKEPHPLMKKENKFDTRLLYVINDGKALLPASYLERISGSVEYIEFAQFLESGLDYDKEQIVLFDIENGGQARSLYPVVQLLKEHNRSYGGVTNTQPEQLAKILTTQWECPMLAHPFSPTSFYLFSNELYGLESLFLGANSQHAQEELLGSNEEDKYQGHVLLVEDNSINQIVAGEMLHSFGLTYDIAEDGQQAVTKVKNSPYYDLILMDIQMPVLDGHQATAEIRKLDIAGLSKVPILGLSANAMKQDFEKAQESGMNEYLTKPIKRETLRLAINKYLQKQV